MCFPEPERQLTRENVKNGKIAPVNYGVRNATGLSKPAGAIGFLGIVNHDITSAGF
jgi:hypothetical protein